MNCTFNQIKTQLIELVVPANSTLVNFTFNQQQQLLMKDIISIETFTVTDFPLSPLGNVLPTYAQLAKGFITFYGSNPQDTNAKGQWLYNKPLISLHRVINGTDPYVRDLWTLMPRNITWEKCQINLPVGPLGNTEQLSFVFDVGYSGNEGD
jgi:hypothetical protein